MKKNNITPLTVYDQDVGPNVCPGGNTIFTARPSASKVLKTFTFPYHCGGVWRVNCRVKKIMMVLRIRPVSRAAAVT